MAAVIAATVPAQAEADTLGIDVSRWQGTIDWNAASAMATFAIIKAGGSDGELYTDSQFYRNRDEVRRLGMQRGYYYFAGGGNPVQEAEHFVSIIGPLQPGEVVALDFEIDHPDPVGYSLSFLIRTTELTGAKPLLYTNMNRVLSYDWRPVADSGYHLWGAIYDENPAYFQGGAAWPRPTIKQYSSAGQVPGISANTVDMNVFRGTVEFTEMGYKPPAPPPPPAPGVEETTGQEAVAGEVAREEVAVTIGAGMTEVSQDGQTVSPAATGVRISGKGYPGTGGKAGWKEKLIDADAGGEGLVADSATETGISCLLALSCSDIIAPQSGLEMVLSPLD